MLLTMQTSSLAATQNKEGPSNEQTFNAASDILTQANVATFKVCLAWNVLHM